MTPPLTRETCHKNSRLFISLANLFHLPLLFEATATLEPLALNFMLRSVAKPHPFALAQELTAVAASPGAASAPSPNTPNQPNHHRSTTPMPTFDPQIRHIPTANPIFPT